MKKEELRIGNLTSKGVIIALHQFSALANDGSLQTYYDYREIKLIPLTEEWLLKLGFYPCKNQEWMLCKGALCLNTGNNNIWEYGGKVLTSPKHVHQLQNLYFALTGEELIIKDGI